MDCTLQVLTGPQAGTAVTLQPGANVIGRGPKAQIQIAAPSISYEHALITLNRDECTLENLSSYGTFVNNEKVTGKIRLRSRDQIRLAPDIALRIDNAPGGEGGGRRSLYMLVTVAVMVTALIVVFFAPWESSGPQVDWDNAYSVLSGHLGKQAQAHRFPANIVPLFDEAWRLEQAKDYQNSQKVWLKLQILLDQSDEQTKIFKTSADNPQALSKILVNKQPDRVFERDELDAALVQFVKRRSVFAAKQGPKPRLGV